LPTLTPDSFYLLPPIPCFLSFLFTDSTPPETYPLSLHDALPILNLAKSAEIVHVLGGGWFNDTWPHHLKVLAGAACLGTERKVMTGQGFIPGDEIKERLGHWLQRFDHITVRDEPSEALFADLAQIE